MGRRMVAMAATVALVLVGLTACGDEPEPDPTPTESAGFDPEALDLGRIDPTPTDLSAALNGKNSRLVAAYELGSHLVLPQDLRTSLNKFGVETGVVIEPSDYDFAFSDAAPALVGAEAGILSRRVDQNADAWITTAILQFPDDASAEAAEQASAAALTAPDPSGVVATLVVEPVATDDQAVAVVATDDNVSNQMYVLRAYGPFLVYGWFYDINGELDDLRALSEEFLADQELALEDVEPVEITEEPRIRDLDPTGIWHLTLAVDGSGSIADTAYVSDDHAAQIRQINSDGIRRAFNRAGVSRVASNLTSVYATENAEGAESLRDDFLTQATDLGMVEVEAPQGLEDAVCLAKEDLEDLDLTFWPEFMCFHAFGAYLLESSGISLVEAQQRISAQALLIYEQQQDQKRSSG